MRTLLSYTGPLTGPYGSGRGPLASTLLGVCGVLWLLFAFVLTLCVADGKSVPERAGAHPTRMPTNSAGLLDSAESSNGLPLRGLALLSPQMQARLQQLVEEALRAALPHAGVREESARTASVPTVHGASAVVSAPAAVNTPAAGSVRHYVVTGANAPLRLGLALCERLRAAMSGAANTLAGKTTNTSTGKAASTAASLAAPLATNGAASPVAHAGLFANNSALTVQPEVVWTEDGNLEIRLNDQTAYIFRFPGKEKSLSDLARPFPAAALVVVLDDMGQRLEAAEVLAALPFPVAFAIWPDAVMARQTATLAGQMGLDCLVHLPMEPLPRAGRRPDPGKNALVIGMNATQIAAVLESALLQTPSAIGLNNHMGSRFTGHAASCKLLCEQLSGRGLFVLDSVTQPASQLARQARALGLVSASRTVFLDSRRDVAAITAALEDAAAAARKSGFAVAVGHPYPETLRALRNWQNSTSVAVVPLRRLIWQLATQARERQLAPIK